MTLLDVHHIRQAFSVPCNSCSEILTALETVETVVHSQRHLLDADTFPVLSGGRTWQGFVARF